MNNLNLDQLRKELSEEWNKPKAQNINNKHDKREARSYKKIKELQEQIKQIKNNELRTRHQN
jgi:ribosomal protein L29